MQKPPRSNGRRRRTLKLGIRRRALSVSRRIQHQGERLPAIRGDRLRLVSSISNLSASTRSIRKSIPWQQWRWAGLLTGEQRNGRNRPVAVIHPSGCIAARTSEVPHQAASPALCGRRNALARPPARTIALKRSATVSCVRRLPRDSRHGHLQSNDSLPRMNERSMTTVDCVISITWSGLLPRTLLWFDDRLMLRYHAHTDDAPRGLHKLMCKPAVSRNSVGPRSD